MVSLARVLLVAALFILSAGCTENVHFIRHNVKRLRTALGKANKILDYCFKQNEICHPNWTTPASKKIATSKVDKIIETYLRLENVESFKKIDKVMHLQ